MPKSAEDSKKRMSGEQRKAQIVTVAMQLFAEEGFKGTTTREIARRAGISEAVIFKHFSKKEDLYNAIIDQCCNDGGGESRLLKLLKQKQGREVFSEVAMFLITEHQNDSTFLKLLTYSALEKHTLSDIFIKTKAMELIEFLVSHIKSLMDEGVFRKADHELAARAFLGMVLHFNIAQELYGLKKTFKRQNSDVVDTFVDIFFDGMKRR
ncbi:MAG: TetR/AcrR family transcriptional regulator [Deltaproteobacteria bacterium]|nr:TetR/AcrR family transcriptional regulator [Deltaproteobacteria bacterium]